MKQPKTGKQAGEGVDCSPVNYRLLVENMEDIVFTTDLSLQLTYVSPSIEKVLGYTPEERMGQPIQERLAPESFKLAADTLSPEIDREQDSSVDPYRVITLELGYLHKDGSLRVLETAVKGLRDQEEKLIGIFGFSRDVTARKRAEEARNGTLVEWDTIFQAIGQPVLILDPQSKIIAANLAVQKATGQPLEILRGKPCYEVFHRSDHPPSGCPFQKMMTSGSPETVEMEAEALGGIYLVSCTPISDADGHLKKVIHIATDITEPKRLERERLEMERRLQQMEKSESLGRMAGAIAHHFNNLLGVVIGNLEMALWDLPSASSTRDNLEEALKASRRAAEVSALMLAYLGKTLVRREPLDVVQVLREAQPLLSASLPKEVRLKTDSSVPKLIIRADALHLRQILTNLVVNAGEAMGDRVGEVAVSVSVIPAAEIRLLRFFPVNWEPREESYLCLSVSDEGGGMDSSILEKIFDPFFTTKLTGRGLGLAVVLGLAGAQEGALAVETKAGRGTTFRVFLPLPDQALLPAREEEAIPTAPQPGRGWVLVVEDEASVRKMDQALLRRLGYEEVTAVDGIEALEVFRRHQDRIGCVLLDLTMPRLDGWQTLTALRALRPDLPVILASGYSQAQAMEGAPAEKPQVFLTKPYSMADLKAALEAVMP